MSSIAEAKNMRQGISVLGTIERKGNIRTVQTKFGKTVNVSHAILVDDSDEIIITLWENDAKTIENHDKILIENGYMNEYNGKLQLTKGKFGTLQLIEKNNRSQIRLSGIDRDLTIDTEELDESFIKFLEKYRRRRECIA